MIRLCVLLGVLLIFAGCTSPGDRAQWEEALKDLREEIMQMQGSFSSAQGTDNSSLRPSSR
jgi:hypothetical protein